MMKLWKSTAPTSASSPRGGVGIGDVAVRLSLCAVLTALASGCGTIIVEHAPTGPTAPVHAGEVTIVMEGGEQPKDLQEIAIIQVQATGVKAELPQAINALKARARELGCDTVAKVSVDRGSSMVVTGVCGRRRPVANAPTEECPTGPQVVYGFDNASVGPNQLPIAILCEDYRSLGELRSGDFKVEFSGPGPAKATPIQGTVEYREGAHVVGSGERRLSYDYVILASFDRPGTWLMRYEIKVPGSQLLKSGRDLVVHVAGAQPNATDTTPPGK